MKKIGITMRVDVSEHGERRNSLDMQWTLLLRRLGFFPVLIPNVAGGEKGFIEEHNLSGFILSGGNDTLETGISFDEVRQNFEMKLLTLAEHKKLPVIGICRGMQMINLYCGGKNKEISDHVAKDHPIDWNGETLVVNSFHNYGITGASLGDGLLAEATAEDGSIEAIRHTTLPWFGVMWHPERTIPQADRHHLWLAKILSGEMV